jgi:hypothetical protein
MAKSPGFWFFTGDWMKDPELRFCSLFARGLLVDLLCILFEANEQGYASNPDGTPRTDEQIADAVSGGSREEKLAALSELERSGVLSRDSRGVLFSRRIARLAELSSTRKQNGSKGGSKTQAKPKQTTKQTPKQTDKQNGGVSVSDSDSDSFLIHTHTQAEASDEFRKPGWAAEAWAEFVARWNVTERAAKWTPFVAPTGWVDLAASPGWLDRARQAMGKLPGCKFFETPLAVTKFFEFVDRILAGEFDHPQRKYGRPTPGGDDSERKAALERKSREFAGLAPAPYRSPKEVAALAAGLKLKEEDL